MRAAPRHFERRAKAADRWARHAAVEGDAEGAARFTELAGFWWRKRAEAIAARSTTIAVCAGAVQVGLTISWCLGWWG